MKKVFKSGFVAIIGRPNVGKSTLLNQILGQKIVITTDKAQTTRKRIKGILTTDDGQIIFIDTPGIHKPLNKLGQFLLDEAKIALPDADLILFLVDGSEPAGRGDKWIVENMLKDSKIPVLLILNKVDKVKNPVKIEENLLSYKALFGTEETKKREEERGKREKKVESVSLCETANPLTLHTPPSASETGSQGSFFAGSLCQPSNPPLIKISAKTGRNKDTLIENIMKNLPEGVKLYPDDIVTEETMRDVAQEIIREKILINTKEEIPHSVAVLIEKYEETDKIDKIYASIYCEVKSQKGILIGKGGSLLKKIGTEARLELEEIAGKKVYLELNVKVEKDWRKSNKALKHFGYEGE